MELIVDALLTILIFYISQDMRFSTIYAYLYIPCVAGQKPSNYIQNKLVLMSFLYIVDTHVVFLHLEVVHDPNVIPAPILLYGHNSDKNLNPPERTLDIFYGN